MKNTGLMLISVFIALGLYGFVSSQSNSSVISLVVPVEVQNLPQEKLILLPNAPQATVTLRGPSFIVSGVAASPPVFRVKFPSEPNHREKIQLSADKLTLPPAIEVLNIEPNEMEFVLDEQTTREVSVVVPRIGQLANDIKLERIEILPSIVQVTGPKTELNEMTSVQAGPIDLRDIRESTSKTVTIRVPGSYSRLDRTEVEVRVMISPIVVERKFDKVPLEVHSSISTNLKVAPSTVSIELSGAEEKVKSLKRRDLNPFTKLTKSSPIGANVEVEIDLPEGISLVYVDPKTVKVVAPSGAVKKE